MEIEVNFGSVHTELQGIERSYDVLRNFPLLANFSDEKIQRIHKKSSYLTLQEGQPIFNKGDVVERFYLVVSGRVKLYLLSPSGQEKTIEVISSYHMFAEALMFRDITYYPVNACALTKSSVIGIDSRDFKNMLKDSMDTCFLLMGNMSVRLQSMIHDIDMLSLQTAPCRVASYILEHTPLDQNSFKLDLPKNLVASKISVTPETLSRILKGLSKKNILVIKGSEITIKDHDALLELRENNFTMK